MHLRGERGDIAGKVAERDVGLGETLGDGLSDLKLDLTHLPIMIALLVGK